ncbi:MAG: TlpA family protein disulfide reductase [Halobacteriales archaeon]
MDTLELTRRRMIEGASVLAAALAGCGSDPARSTEEGIRRTTDVGSRRTTEDGSRRAGDGGPTPTSPDRSTSTGVEETRSGTRTTTRTRSAEPTSTAGAGGETDSILLPSLDVRGSPGDLVRLRPPGKVVLLDFFATWCPPCEPEMDNLRAAREQFSEDSVSIVSITRETDEETIEQFWEANEGTWPVVKDPGLRAFREYGVTGLPTILVFTPGGDEVMRHNGLAGEDRIVSNLEAALEEA